MRHEEIPKSPRTKWVGYSRHQLRSQLETGSKVSSFGTVLARPRHGGTLLLDACVTGCTVPASDGGSRCPQQDGPQDEILETLVSVQHHGKETKGCFQLKLDWNCLEL